MMHGNILRAGSAARDLPCLFPARAIPGDPEVLSASDGSAAVAPWILQRLQHRVRDIILHLEYILQIAAVGLRPEVVSIARAEALGGSNAAVEDFSTTSSPAMARSLVPQECP
jgi:hypothetical protein